ncbi:phosphate ABC transporter ATP-binding protein, PhoT family [Jannaschia faecimaris]|uniref:Phosphate ABC transporter ATP-binding protein, PhoT family n=1 Tax=Jannaschia faecimaris TaxID=1244108 RepID=A0A1H3JP74_9RHOB|nr:ATP-binding cassette domain-containing protein [Jannaschia faecimaris]SDY41074.1 phosphate ABC transporter ATP-binding protein, PhoT family [Jannaschia faecimaris]
MVSALPLTLAGATLRRRGKVLVGPVDLKLGERGVTVVIGPNGSGKTSLLRMMHGLQRVAAGSVTWSLPDTEARRRQAYVFQQPIALRRSVLANLVFPLRLHGMPRAQATAMARTAASRFDLTAKLEQSAPSLSGGEMQRLALARALIATPEILFADEPCAALDGSATRQIESHLVEAAASGTRLVMATHDMGQARRIADDVIFLLHGRIHETGPATAFFDGPDTAEARAFLRGDIVD